MTKRVVSWLLILGWIPTLAIIVGPRWLTGSPLLAQRHTPMKVTRIYTGADGKTKVEEYEVPLSLQGRGTELSKTVDVKTLQFRRTNQDYSLDWHSAPARQFVVTQGHISRAIGSEDRLSLFITLADGAVPPR